MADYDNDNDNKNNDEYHFEDIDTPGNQTMEDLDSKEPPKNDTSGGEPPRPEKGETARKAISLLVVLVMLVAGYKLIAYLFSGKPKPTTPPIVEVAKTPPKVEPVVVSVPDVIPQETALSKELQQKVSAIEFTQATVKNQVITVNEKVTVVSTNVEQLNTQIKKLNEMIERLANQVNQQSHEINILIARARPKQIKTRIISQEEQIIYFIQAVIPGRAWLIGSNGSTLSVREGTRIPGYGVVKLVDSLQGRVLTSSGRVIRFSQDDS